MKKKSTSQTAFFKLRVLVAVLLCFAAITIGAFAFNKASAQPRSPAQNPQPLVRAEFRGVMPVVKFAVSPPLRSMKPLLPKKCTKHENEEQGPIPMGPVGPVKRDPVVQRVISSIGIPEPIVSFDGNPNLCGCQPPDPNGAIGPNHVVTMANLHFQIFDRNGVSLFGPAANNTLWAGFGGDCETDNAGDPVVIYDQLADRWVLSQFTSSGPTFFECFAVSQTADPTGSYFLYAISTGNNFPDYPKAGMWPDAYYFSTREFLNGATFVGVGAYAVDRAQVLAGNPAPTIVGFLAPPGGQPYNVGDGLLPSDLDGQTLPPDGNDNPNYFVGSMDDNGPYGAPQDALTVWKFDYDETTPGNSTFTLTNTVPVGSFNSILALCGGTRNCIPQPNTAAEIDHLGYRQRPLFRLSYRNFGTHEALVTNQSVSAGNGPNGEVSGIRWWEIRDPNGSPTIFQEGTYAPGVTDGVHRWMASISFNANGDIALAYSASNGTNPSVFPSVWYTGRLAGDPPGQMTLGEGSIICGTGSQTSGPRWGDYTSLDVDPVDDLSFWHVNEYLPSTGGNWRLRIGAFNLTTGAQATPCPIGPTPTPTPTVTPTPTPSCPPIFSENFDSVTPPTLPPDWLATQGVNNGGFPFWETSNSGVPIPPADSPPNSVFTPDPDNLLDNRLDSATIVYTSPSAQLTFRHNYNLEEQDPTIAYDNGLLEISTDGGATFQEITDAGGSFVTGGYDHQEISDGFENPCFQQYGTARPNWSGLSNGGAGGFQTTTVNLPAAGAGQNVRIRWRMCSDNSVNIEGWRVDNVSVIDTCPTPTPTPTATPSVTPTVTPTPSVTPSPTARPSPTPRPRGTPRPRP